MPVSANYAELQITSNFSFLRGGSHAHELAARAEALGLAAIAVVDRNTLAGVVRAHLAAKEAGLRLIVGARLDLKDAPSLLCLPTDRTAYGRLSRLLSLGQGRAEKGECTLYLDDVAVHAEGQIFVALPPDDWSWQEVHASLAGPPCAVAQADNIITFPGTGMPERLPDDGGARDDQVPPARPAFEADLQRICDQLTAASGIYLALSHLYRGDDQVRMAALAGLAAHVGIETVATNDVLYHVPERRPLQDVLTCVREKTTIADAGLRLAANGERHLKSATEMLRLFEGHEQAVANTLEIARGLPLFAR